MHNDYLTNYPPGVDDRDIDGEPERREECGRPVRGYVCRECSAEYNKCDYEEGYQ